MQALCKNNKTKETKVKKTRTKHNQQNTKKKNVTIYLEGLADMATSNWLTSMVENNP